MNKNHSSAWLWPVIGVLCLAGAIIIGINVCTHHVLGFDTACYDWLAAHIISPSLTPLVLAVTRLASAAALVPFAVLALVFIGNKRIGLAVAINLALSAVLNQLVKSIVRRPRPDVPRLAVEGGFSFPSGHAMAATTFYGFLIYLVWRYWRNRTAQTIAIAVLALLVPTIMVSRVYLGVHYASDVLAGCLCGVAYLSLLYIPLAKRTLLPSGQPR